MIRALKRLFVFTMLSVVLISCNANYIAKEPQVKNIQNGGDWEETAPEQQGMDPLMLSKAEENIKSEFANVYSLVIIKNGKLVYEKYFSNQGKDTPVHVFSVTKSVTSALMGIALREGFITSLEQKLSEFFPEHFKSIDDPRKREITLKQGLTMTAGLTPSDRDFYQWATSKSWFEYSIKQPLIDKPGEKFNYDTGLTHLLSGVLTKATKQSTMEFANSFLFSHLGIKNVRWATDNEGYYGGGHLLSLTPRDMAKFGYLYLKEGQWNGKQVVPAEWVRESFRNHIKFNKDSGYGYLWWINSRFDEKRDKSLMIYSALGHGGQRIDIVPDLDIVAVITADPDKSARNNIDTGEILTKFIIPSVK